MKKSVFAILLLALELVSVNPAMAAANAANGYITGFVAQNNGTVFFFQNGTLSGSHPACDTGGLPQRWALDATTAAGQALLSLLITAKVTHQIIKINGSGTCPSGGNSESPGLFVTDDVQ